MAAVPRPSDDAAPVRPYRLNWVGWLQSQASPWWIMVAGGAAALALGLGLLGLFQLLARPLALLFLGVVIASAVSPAANWLHRRLPWFLAVVIPYFLALLILLLALGAGIPPLVAQVEAAATQLPAVLDTVWAWVAQQGVVENQRLIETLLSRLDAAFGLATGLPVAIVTTVVEIVTVIFISLYWLLSAPSLRRFALSLAPSRQRDGLDSLFSEMGGTMGGYVRGVFIDSLAIGIAAYIGFIILGMPYPLVLALVAGVMEAVPYIGPIVSGAIVMSVAFFVSPALALAVLVFWTALQQFENNVLVPYVMRSQTAVPPVLVVFAIIAGLTVGGILGALVAVPLCGALRVFIVRAVAPAVRQWTGAEPTVASGDPASREQAA